MLLVHKEGGSEVVPIGLTAFWSVTLAYWLWLTKHNESVYFMSDRRLVCSEASKNKIGNNYIP